MSFPFEYDHGAPLMFGGALPVTRSFEESRAVVLPVPLDRTTSYVPGTRNGPREILQASSHMELWDEEIGADIHPIGIFTLPEMELPFGELAPLMDEIRRVAAEILARGKFLVTLGGEHSITPPLVAAAAARHPGLSVLQIDAHADLRDCYMGTPHNHACAMRRSLEYAPITQVGIRSMSTEEAEVVTSLRTTMFYDHSMRADPYWMDRRCREPQRQRLSDDRRRRDGSGDHAGDRDAGARRTVVVRDARPAAESDRQEVRRGLRYRGAEPTARPDGAEFPLCEAGVQDSGISIPPVAQVGSAILKPGH